MSLNVFSVWYNYFDFQFHWSALDISLFFSAFGLALAATSGLGIRFLVPQRLSEEQGVLLGLFLQVWVVLDVMHIILESCREESDVVFMSYFLSLFIFRLLA